MSLFPRQSRESRTRSPYVFMHIQISPPLSLSILSTSEILFFFNFLRRAFLRGRSGSSYVVASLRNRKSPARSPVASAWFLTLYLGVRREGEERGRGIPSSLLITILCDSLSWFVTVARLKERSAGWGTRMALAWARRGATRTERRREKEREKKIGVLRSARKLVISWNEIFFSLREAIGHALPAIHPFVRRNDRWIGNFEAPNHPRDRPTCFSLFLCLLDGSAVTSDKDDLRSSYFQLITAIHYGEGRRTRVCVYVYDVQCWNLFKRVFKIWKYPEIYFL